jgi:hypothetical protein
MLSMKSASAMTIDEVRAEVFLMAVRLEEFRKSIAPDVEAPPPGQNVSDEAVPVSREALDPVQTEIDKAWIDALLPTARS